MSYNGSGTFQINTSGQPVVAGTVISSTAFNALTADLATGLSTAITKDGQTTTTARIPFAAGINSSLVTDSSSTSTGSIITAGGVGIAKALYVGTNANVAGTLAVTGVATFSAAPIYSSLTASSAVATDASKALVSVTNTGTGNNVLATSPTLVTPILGTPTSGSLVNCTDTNYTGFKNRIINGAMPVSQYYGSTDTAVTGSTQYMIDRWRSIEITDGAMSVQQSTTSTAGFNNSMKFTVTTADASLSASQLCGFNQFIEGYNTADLGWGTANAATVTLSFWVRSSLTGTFAGAFRNSATNRTYIFTYTISVANTFEYKTITVAGDTSGTWLTTNGTGIDVIFSLGTGTNYQGTAGSWQASDAFNTSGAVSVIGTLNATFYITGVQLEKGSTATSFDYRPYGTELALCQRYYFVATGNKSNSSFPALGSGNLQSSTLARIYIKYPVDMRAAPTSAISGSVTISANADYTSTAITVAYNGISSSMMGFAVAGATTGNGATAYANGTNNYLDFTAEL